MESNVAHKNLALLLLAGAQFLVVLDATIVNVALPSIQYALHFSNASSLQWIITAYTLTFGGLLLLGGRLADLYGRRKIFLTGIIVFFVASLAAGLSRNSGTIITFRAIQGIGAALLSPAALSLILNIFKEGKERNTALGVWSGVAAGGGAIGLLLGGILTQYVNWRWIFFINVPVGLFIAFFSMRYVPRMVETIHDRKLDILGAILVTGGLMTLVYSFIKAASYGWTDHKTLLLLGAAVVLLDLFLINELMVKKPLVDLRIFMKRNITVGNLMQLPVAAAMYGTFFYLSIYFQEILKFSPFKAGAASVPFTIFLVITAGLASRFVTKIKPKIILTITPLLMAAGLFYFSRIPVFGNYWSDIFPGIAVMASGMGATFVVLTLVATSGVRHDQSGLASGLLNTTQQIGGALGLAILTVLSTTRTQSVLASSHGDPGAIPAALVAGYRHAFSVAAGFALAAAVLALIGLKGGKQSIPATDQEEVRLERETVPA